MGTSLESADLLVARVEQGIRNHERKQASISQRKPMPTTHPGRRSILQKRSKDGYDTKGSAALQEIQWGYCSTIG
jgi:hypothetical protein